MTEFTFYCWLRVHGDRKWIRQTFSHPTFFKITDDLRAQGDVYFAAMMTEHASSLQCPECGNGTEYDTPVEIFGSLLTRPPPHQQDVSVATFNAAVSCGRPECSRAIRAVLLQDRNRLRERLRANPVLVPRR